jgi:hypothetical protein
MKFLNPFLKASLTMSVVSILRVPAVMPMVPGCCPVEVHTPYWMGGAMYTPVFPAAFLTTSLIMRVSVFSGRCAPCAFYCAEGDDDGPGLFEALFKLLHRYFADKHPVPPIPLF